MSNVPQTPYDSSKLPFSVMGLAQLYGPYAFGVASLLLIWFSIVKPQLELQRVDFQINLEVVKEMNKTSSNQVEITKTLERVTQSLSESLDILERTLPK